MNEISDLEFMQQPSRWPYWPLLPIKKRQGIDWTAIGCLYAENLEGPEQVRPLVHNCLMFHIKDPHETTVYPTWQALIDDGWVVD